VAITVAVAFSPRWRTGLALITCAFVSLVVLSAIAGSVPSRYASFAAALVIASFLVSYGAQDASNHWFPWALIVLCVPWALSLPVNDYRASGPSWNRSIEHARANCNSKGATNSTVVLLPLGPSGWGVARLPCEVLK
jgi:hypothetical protein